MNKCTLTQQIENARARIIQYDNQIDGSLREQIDSSESSLVRERLVRMRQHLIALRGRLACFLIMSSASVPKPNNR